MIENEGDELAPRDDEDEQEDDVVFPEEEAQRPDAAGATDDQDASEDSELSEVEKANAERDRMREQLLRIAADFDNFRKRSRKEIEEVRRRAIEDTLREVLPIVDNLERAVDAMTDASDVAAVTDGVRMVLRGFDEVAHRLELKRVPGVGNQFDPNCHDAMQQEATDDHEPGTIVAEIVPGYYLGDRLLRAAMVVVAVPAAKTDDQEASSPEDSDSTE